MTMDFQQGLSNKELYEKYSETYDLCEKVLVEAFIETDNEASKMQLLMLLDILGEKKNYDYFKKQKKVFEGEAGKLRSFVYAILYEITFVCGITFQVQGVKKEGEKQCDQ